MLIKFEVQIKLPIIRLDSIIEWLKQVLDAVHGERRFAKDAHDFEDGSANPEIVLNDGNEAVGDDGHVYLYADCVFGFSPETLDLEVLLDPFEIQLHLPPVFIEQGDVLCTEVEVVRIVDEASMKLWRIIDNSSDNTGILLLISFLVKRMVWSLSTLSAPSRILSPLTTSYAGLPFSLMIKNAPNTLIR